MNKYFDKIGLQLWHNPEEVYNAVSKGYLYAGKNITQSPFLEYLKSIK
jgi:hypothetical protein